MSSRIPLFTFLTTVVVLPWIHAAGDRFAVTVSHTLDIARPAAVIEVPFAEVRRRLPDVTFDHVRVRNANTGALVPFQITNFTPNVRPAQYDDLIWQHDFAAGERVATYLIELTDSPVPPFPSRVMARHVPERLDDFAWENDRMAHRAYGARLDTDEAGSSRLRSSGLDFWVKRVRYPVVDRWYLKGHDAYHIDTGEGLDMYSVGTTRGVGGTGVRLPSGAFAVGGNWVRARVLANGPIRAVFELDYAPWAAGDGLRVAETKRFTVDAGHHLDRIESTLTIEGAKTLPVMFGLTWREELSPITATGETGNWISNWSHYPDGHGAVGTGLVLHPAHVPMHGEDVNNRYLGTTVNTGETATYYAGGGWTGAGDFDSAASWQTYLEQYFQRLNDPLKLTFDPAE